MTRGPRHLLEMIDGQVQRDPDRIAFTFLGKPGCTWGQFNQGIEQVAALLLHNRMPFKAKVIIAIPNSTQFFFAFYGAMRAGGIAVPVSPAAGKDRIEKLARLCGASFLLTLKKESSGPAGERCDEQGQNSLNVHLKHLAGEKKSNSTRVTSFPEIAPGDTAFIQFTSGSTGDPKGVRISHKGLMVNISQMIEGMRITRKDIFVSWLPVFHDMGLILMTMVPMFLAKPFYLLPVGIKYLKDWLWIICEKKATFTAAPDFMYRITMRYIANPGDYDLSSLRVGLNAAEPVRAATIQGFETMFNIRDVLVPAYGLAEATVGVSCWYPGRPVRVDGNGNVCVGQPFPGIKIRINENEGPGRGQGEILVRSPANTPGYFKNTRADANLFARDNFIRTGDLGYLDDEGDLYVIGRKKNIIIQGGVSISSREVEELIETSSSMVRRSAAAGIDRGGPQGEQVFIFAEVKLTPEQWGEPSFTETLKIELVQLFHGHFGFRPGRVLLLKPGLIPTTLNGKTQYPALIKQVLSGRLGG